LVPVAAAVSEAVSGSSIGATSSTSTAAPTSPPATRTTYRSLLLKGLAPDEAANLTAFLCGIHVGSQPWKLPEVNRLLFLRELQLSGRFGSDDGAATPASR
jgi:hypothetical protein